MTALSIVSSCFLCLFFSTFAFSFLRLDRLQSVGRNLHVLAGTTNEKGNIKIRLPIVQIYQDGALSGEFIYDNSTTILDFYGKLLSSIKTLQPHHDSKAGSSGVTNVYDESQLSTEISSGNPIIFKLYRGGCKKCKEFEPLYVDLSENFNLLQWFQGDADYLPTFVERLKTRLLGASVTTISDCSVCSNTGFVQCKECMGKGLVTRGELTILCSRCVGT